MSSVATRDHIVEAADRLFYEAGYEHASFSDIAAAVGISRGNFYYYFKTKDEILAAVIDRRLANTRAMLDRWEAEGASPAERLRSFVRILVANRASIMKHGCPAGTLCSELAKLDHGARDGAAAVMALFRAWLARQFAALGRDADADALALHLLARSQGVAVLANAFRDEDFIDREVEALCAWVDSQKHRKA